MQVLKNWECGGEKPLTATPLNSTVAPRNV